VEKPDIVSK